MPERVYINSENKATFLCPVCSKSRVVDVAKYLKTQAAVKVTCKCKCGHSYSVILERRKDFRKTTNLPGRFFTSKGKQGLMTVTDISRSGLGFKMNIYQDIKVGEKLKVEFNLDDQPRSLINREVVVKTIRDNHIGTEFTSLEHYDRLGPYLI